jgi:hypothetical protein
MVSNISPYPPPLCAEKFSPKNAWRKPAETVRKLQLKRILDTPSAEWVSAHGPRQASASKAVIGRPPGLSATGSDHVEPVLATVRISVWHGARPDGSRLLRHAFVLTGPSVEVKGAGPQHRLDLGQDIREALERGWQPEHVGNAGEVARVLHDIPWSGETGVIVAPDVAYGPVFRFRIGNSESGC